MCLDYINKNMQVYEEPSRTGPYTKSLIDSILGKREIDMNNEEFDCLKDKMQKELLETNYDGPKIDTCWHQPTYSGFITNIDEDGVFVFGSNPQGINGGGAARVAAEQGWCERREALDNKLSASGKAFGLCTVRGPNMPLSKTMTEIADSIKILYETALQLPQKNFFVAYTYDGKDTVNLNGYTTREMAAIFLLAGRPAENIVFHDEFYKLMKSLYCVP